MTAQVFGYIHEVNTSIPKTGVILSQDQMDQQSTLMFPSGTDLHALP